MSQLKSVSSKYEKLSSEWNKKKGRSLEVVGSLLSELKVSLTELSFLPTESHEVSPQELLLARSVLEIGAQYSVEVRDLPGFERYMAQLKTYYSDYPELKEESAFMYELLGLNLLRLLCQNQLAEFHIQLELLPVEALLSNPYISTPVALSKCAKMLYLKDKEMGAFAKEREWLIQPDKFVYFDDADKKTQEPEVPTLELAKMAISYAKEMEAIV
ncbi:26S proteasome non-ATPase regulatory subunit 8 [Caligus rogercresseyi]|uniref:26S proteasome non-ATPase regulatory subunit 8 n=1 Tax=Caligus rogercresseyi TaxID=217165 RepID=A0A7T8HG47_CALRO|nr:26S proteasome non-ATPase regulatory subunit 8 [Caligus rogercresseyi]